MADPLFNLNELEEIDGSALLIDLDQNNTVDLINMLLVDQGWFDTRRDVVGLIGDPLIPVSTVQTLAPQGGGAGGWRRRWRRWRRNSRAKFRDSASRSNRHKARRTGLNQSTGAAWRE